MIHEFPVYVRRVSELPPQPQCPDLMEWYNDHQESLPSFFSGALVASLIQPSSAAAERMFSMLKAAMVNDNGGLEDHTSGMCMLRYNELWRSKLPA